MLEEGLQTCLTLQFIVRDTHAAEWALDLLPSKPHRWHLHAVHERSGQTDDCQEKQPSHAAGHDAYSLPFG